MAPSVSSKRVGSGTDQVRARLLTALHLGKLRPGDRVLSVRRLSDVTGINRKTVHRAYRLLAHEGLLDVRPGSGTFIAQSAEGDGAQSTADLLSAVNRCRAEARSLGIPPEVFTAFLNNHLGDGLRELRVAVVECNREQVEIISRDLVLGLGIAARPVLLRDLQRDPRRALEGASGIVTTDCHRAEVAEAVAALDLPVYRVSLDPDFPQKVLEHARNGPVIMVVRDVAFAAPFTRLLRQLAVQAEIANRVRIVGPFQARAAVQEAGERAVVHVSPLVAEGTLGVLPPGARKVQAHWHLTPEALEGLRAALALELAVRDSQS